MRALTRVMAVTNWRLAILLLLVVSLLVPVIVASGFFFPYVVPRNIFFRAIVEVGALILVWSLCWGGDDLDLRYEPIFWALVAFVTAAFVSALFSPARDHSLFGDFERMGGVWAWLHLALFFLLLRTLRDDEWPWVLNAALLVGVFISISAILEHSQLLSTRGSSDAILAPSNAAIGNGGLLAAYLLFAIGLAGYLSTTSVRFRLLYLAVGGINLLALLAAENRSTVIGLVLGGLVGSVIFATLRTKSKKRWIAPGVAIALASTVIAVTLGIRAFPSTFLTRVTPTVLQRLALTSSGGPDDARTMQWRAAIEGFRDRPLLGYGPENHDLVWSAHFDPGIYSFSTDIFDRTHNQFLEVLATTGLVGTVAFLGIWLAIAVTLLRAYRDDRLSTASLAVLGGLQVAYATYLLLWFVDLNSTMLWILFAALIASRENRHGIIRPTLEWRRHQHLVPVTVALASVLLFATALYTETYMPVRANRALAQLDSRQGSVRDNLGHFEVLAHTGGHQTAHTPAVMAQYLNELYPRFAEMRRNPAERRLVESAFGDAISAFKEEIHRDTLNDKLYTGEAHLLLDAAGFYGSRDYIDQAIDALKEAIELSPHRIQPRMALATLYVDDHNYEKARGVLDDAIKADPMLGEPRYWLAEQYLRSGKSDSALTAIQASLGRGYVGVPEVYLAIGKRLEFSGRGGDAAKLYSSYLEAKYTKAVWDGGTIDKVIPNADIAVAAHLPLLYVRAQDSELAIKTAAALSAFDSSRTDLVERFVSDVGSRRRSRWIAKNSLLPCMSSSAHASTAAGAGALDPCGVFRRKL